MNRAHVLSLIAASLAGCLGPGARPCGDNGLRCAGDDVCVAAVGQCFPQELIRACEGRADGDECMVNASIGMCSVGICQISCGDGFVDDNELCEPDVEIELTCADVGFDMGTLGCLDSCAFDRSSCERFGFDITQPLGDGLAARGLWSDGQGVTITIGVYPYLFGVIGTRENGVWSEQNVPTGLNAVWGRNSQDVVIVGGDGLVLERSGEEWVPVVDESITVDLEPTALGGNSQTTVVGGYVNPGFPSGSQAFVAELKDGALINKLDVPDVDAPVEPGRSTSVRDIVSVGEAIYVVTDRGLFLRADDGGLSEVCVFGAGACDFDPSNDASIYPEKEPSVLDAVEFDGRLVVVGTRGYAAFVDGIPDSPMLAPIETLTLQDLGAAIVTPNGLFAAGQSGYLARLGATPAVLETDTARRIVGLIGDETSLEYLSEISSLGTWLGQGWARDYVSFGDDLLGVNIASVVSTGTMTAAIGRTSGATPGVVLVEDGLNWCRVGKAELGDVHLLDGWAQPSGSIFVVGYRGGVLYPTDSAMVEIAPGAEPCSPVITVLDLEPFFPSLLGSVAGYGDKLYVGGNSGFVAMWDGAVWTEMSMSGGQAREPMWHSGQALYRLEKIGDVETFTVQSHINRHDGVEWQRVHSVDFALDAIWGTGEDNIWAAGKFGVHFDGTTWQARAVGDGDILSLAGTGASDVFALGDNPIRALYRFDGQAWSPFRLPDDGNVERVAAFPNEVFVFGTSSLIRKLVRTY